VKDDEDGSVDEDDEGSEKGEEEDDDEEEDSDDWDDADAMVLAECADKMRGDSTSTMRDDCAMTVLGKVEGDGATAS
jgi:hypothetical protein